MSQVITADRVRLGVSVTTWQEAVRASAGLLVAGGAIEESYVDAIFESFAANGDYMIVVPEVVLAHARPDRGVNATAMSLVTLADPVFFEGDPDRPISAVFTFAAADADSHIEIIQGLAEVLSESDLPAVMRALPDVDAAVALVTGSQP